MEPRTSTDVLMIPYVTRFDATGHPSRDGLPPSFPEHVRQRLEQQVIDGELAPGERVAEESLARNLGISRTPVREAMRLLEGYGLIVRSRGRGTSVAHRTTRTEANALYEIRVALEGHLAGRAAEMRADEDLAALEAIQAAFQRVAASPPGDDKLRAMVGLDHDFHWTIHHAAGSDLISIVSSYWGRLLREVYDRVYRMETPSHFADEHERVVAMLRARDAAGAREAMQGHIRSGWAAIRKSFDEDASRPEAAEPG
jgi:DNA-binding GntR family transcriptional regulator